MDVQAVLTIILKIIAFIAIRNGLTHCYNHFVIQNIIIYLNKTILRKRGIGDIDLPYIHLPQDLPREKREEK